MGRSAWWMMALALVFAGCDDGADDAAGDPAVDMTTLDPDVGPADDPGAAPADPDAGPDDPDADPAMGEPGELWRVDIEAAGFVIGTQLEVWLDADRAVFERAALRAVGPDDGVSPIIGEVTDVAIDEVGRFAMDFGSVFLPPDFNPAGIPLEVVLRAYGRIVEDDVWCGEVSGNVPLLMQELMGATFGAAPWPMQTAPRCPGDGPVMGETIGGDRPAAVLLPRAYDAAEAWPVVVLLHGYRASGRVQATYLRLIERVDADGIILVLPDGTIDGDGERHWQARSCCGNPVEAVDDLSYLTGLVAEAGERWTIDPARVFAVGHSNGGFMAHDLACLASETFRGIVSLAGSAGRAGLDCPGMDVAVLNVHGDADDTILYDGAPWHVGAEASLQRWVDINGCGPSEAGEALDLDTSVDGAETEVSRWTGCTAPVEGWRMVGSGHIPQVDGAFAEAVMGWLLAAVE